MSENLRYYLEKATKEFVFPTIKATPEEIEFVVVPMLEAVEDWLKSQRKYLPMPHGIAVVDLLLTDTSFQFISNKQ